MLPRFPARPMAMSSNPTFALRCHRLRRPGYHPGTAGARGRRLHTAAALLEGGADPQLLDGQGQPPVDLVDDNPRLMPAQKEMVRNALSQS